MLMPSLEHVQLDASPASNCFLGMLTTFVKGTLAWRSLQLGCSKPLVAGMGVSPCTAAVPLVLASNLPQLRVLNMAHWPWAVYSFAVAALHGHEMLEEVVLGADQLIGRRSPDSLSFDVQQVQ